MATKEETGEPFHRKGDISVPRSLYV